MGAVMLAIGCLLLIILPLLGLAGGGMVAGLNGATWGAAIGFMIAAAICFVPGYALIKASRRR